jgi:hypothetical protein
MEAGNQFKLLAYPRDHYRLGHQLYPLKPQLIDCKRQNRGRQISHRVIPSISSRLISLSIKTEINLRLKKTPRAIRRQPPSHPYNTHLRDPHHAPNDRR